MDTIETLRKKSALLDQTAVLLSVPADKILARVKVVWEGWQTLGKVLKVSTANGPELVLQAVERLLEEKDRLDLLEEAASGFGTSLTDLIDSVKNWVLCPECGTKNLGGSEFCNQCGCLLKEATPKWLHMEVTEDRVEKYAPPTPASAPVKSFAPLTPPTPTAPPRAFPAPPATPTPAVKPAPAAQKGDILTF